MKQEPAAGTDATSEELVGVASRFRAWRTINDSKIHGDDGTRSWKLVYGEALDSINRISQSAKLPASAVPPVVLPVTVTVPTPLSVEEASVTDIVTFRSRVSGPSGTSVFLTPETAARAKIPAVVKGFPAGLNAVVETKSPTGFITGFDAVFSRRTGQPPMLAQPSTASFDLCEFLAGEPPEAEAAQLAVAELLRKSALRMQLKRSAKAASSRRRDSSLTVRMTSVEADLLKRKAAEAGVTVSAYLRKCAFDVERLQRERDEMQTELEMLRKTVAAQSLHSTSTAPPTSSCASPRRSATQKLAAGALRFLGVAATHG